MPSGYDAEVAELFRDLRAATALSEMDMAARIGTRPEVVQALEQGALHALPPWAETCRVVNAYGAMLNLDVRPLLRRIYAQLEAGIVELQPKPMPDVPTMMPPDSGDFASGRPAPNHPPAQGQPPHPSWPNPAPEPRQRRPNAGPAPRPQHPRPPVQGGQQPQQAWPQPAPQNLRPNAPVAPGQRPAPGQAPPDRRAGQPRAVQPQPPQPPQPQLQPREGAPSEAEMLQAEFGQAAAPAPEPEKKKRKPALLKLAVGLLIVGVVALGAWILYVYAPIVPGSQTSGAVSTDPEDPRSKKADRLPDAPVPPPAPQ